MFIRGDIIMADEKVLLNDDDLDQVVGGTRNQSIRDFALLQNMGAIPKNFTKPDCAAMVWTFAKYGVKVNAYDGSEDNQYFIRGKEVTAGQALDYVRMQLNK